MPDGTITVVLADDQEMVRTGFRLILSAEDGVEVIGEAGTGVDAVAQARRLRPDVVLMDLNLPAVPGIEATRRIVAATPGTAVLVLTMVDDDDSVMTALRVGARGYVLKGAAQEEVLAAIRSVAQGGAVFGPGVAERVLSGARGSRHAAHNNHMRSLREGEAARRNMTFSG